MSKEKEPYNPFEKTEEEEENFWDWIQEPENEEEEVWADWFETFKDGGLK